MTSSPPPKSMARALRADLARLGLDISHSQALELVAHQLGHRDWNTLAAAPSPERPVPGGLIDTAPDLLEALPILRIFDEAIGLRFYVDYLGFTLDWTHRFGDHMPIYAQVSRGDVRLHLSGHHGDATPGSSVSVRTRDVRALHTELVARQAAASVRPGVDDEPWGLTLSVPDPFGNRITFHQPNDGDEVGHLDEVASPHGVDLEVKGSASNAFDVFTARIREWWDPTYSPFGDDLATVTIEGHVGGAVSMRSVAGDEVTWGTVLVWEPGRRYAQTFTLAHDPTEPSRLDVTFDERGDRCQITFRHGGWTSGNVGSWSRFTDWPIILARFAVLAEGS